MESRISHFVILSYFDGVLWNICFHLQVKNFVDGFNLPDYFLESSTQGTYLFYQDSCILRLFLQPQENIPCQTLTYWELPWLLIRESSFLSQTMYSLLSYAF